MVSKSKFALIFVSVIVALLCVTPFVLAEEKQYTETDVKTMIANAIAENTSLISWLMLFFIMFAIFWLGVHMVFGEKISGMSYGAGQYIVPIIAGLLAAGAAYGVYLNPALNAWWQGIMQWGLGLWAIIAVIGIIVIIMATLFTHGASKIAGAQAEYFAKREEAVGHQANVYEKKALRKEKRELYLDKIIGAQARRLAAQKLANTQDPDAVERFINEQIAELRSIHANLNAQRAYVQGSFSNSRAMVEAIEQEAKRANKIRAGKPANIGAELTGIRDVANQILALLGEETSIINGIDNLTTQITSLEGSQRALARTNPQAAYTKVLQESERLRTLILAKESEVGSITQKVFNDFQKLNAASSRVHAQWATYAHHGV